MGDADDARFLAILDRREPPDPASYKAGADAHAAALPFHAGPRPFESAVALSWRMGWNDHALQTSTHSAAHFMHDIILPCALKPDRSCPPTCRNANRGGPGHCERTAAQRM